MYSKRQNKVSRLLQKEIADIFQRDGVSIAGNALITVTVVRISPDLAVAKVYLSISGGGEADEVLKTIQKNSWQIRHTLGQRVRHQMKKVPELMFFRDDSLDYIDRIDELLKS